MLILLAGLGAALALEGFAYACAPDFMKRLASMASSLPAADLRQAGFLAAAIGLAIVYVCVKLG